MRNIEDIFEKMLPVVSNALSSVTDIDGNLVKIGRKAKFSDVKVITLSLSAEYLSIDSENRLFNLISNSRYFFKQNLIERSTYNRRKKKLHPFISNVLTYLSQQLAPVEDTFIVDSMPIEICRFARAKRLRICKEHFDTAPAFGYCASQRTTFFGYKLHALCGIDGVFKKIDLSKGNVADIHYLQDIRPYLSDCILIGDKGYLSKSIQQDLFQTERIKLYTPKRSNQPGYEHYPGVFRRVRKRIETLFSQLCDQFMMKRNYAKSFKGVAVRILSKITALTMAQYYNKFVNDKPINEIKYAFSN